MVVPTATVGHPVFWAKNGLLGNVHFDGCRQQAQSPGTRQLGPEVSPFQGTPESPPISLEIGFSRV